MRMTRMSLLPTNSTVPTSILFRNSQDTICDSLSISDWSAISSLLIYLSILQWMKNQPPKQSICVWGFIWSEFLHFSRFLLELQITHWLDCWWHWVPNRLSLYRIISELGLRMGVNEGGFFRLNRWKNLRSSIPQGLSKNQINWIPWFEIQPKVKEQEEYHCLKYLNMQIIWSTFLFSNQEDCPNKIELTLICSDWTCLAEESN